MQTYLAFIFSGASRFTMQNMAPLGTPVPGRPPPPPKISLPFFAQTKLNNGNGTG